MAIDKCLLGLYSLNFFINAANSILAPFYPGEALSKGVSQDVIGFIFSSHPLASFVFSLILGKMMNIWGRRKLLIIGLVLQSIGLIVFGAVIFINSQALFIAISIVARVFQGLGLASYLTIAYAYIPLLYPNLVEKKIAMMEMLTGMGLMLGPLLGGVLYTVGGYQTPFYTMAAIFFVVIPLMWKNLPPENYNPPDKSDILLQSEKENKKPQKTLSLIKFLTNRRIFCTFLIVTLSDCMLCFLEPTLSPHLESYTSSTLLISFLFSIGTIFYVIFMGIISFFPKSIDRRLWMILGTFLLSISSFLLGPEPLLSLPHSICWPIISMCILGTGMSFCVLPAIPEFIDIGSGLTNDEEKERVGDMASGLFNSAYSAGAFLGPIIGGVLVNEFNFSRAEGYMGLVILAVLVIYLSVGEAAFAFFKKKRGNEPTKNDIENDGEGKSEIMEKKSPTEE
jgi:MFS family permease